MKKQLILGTAYLGMKYSYSEFIQMYEIFIKNGHYMLDTAVNYPISGNPQDFSAAIKILREVNLPKKSVYVKVGGCQNKGSPETLLNDTYLRFICELVQEYFQDSLFGIGIHWDNRENLQQVSSTLSILESIQNFNLVTGFSGVKQFGAYTSFLNSKQLPYVVQHNLRDLPGIQTSDFSLNWIYGLAKEKLNSPTLSYEKSNELLKDMRINAIMIGPTNVAQLNDWLGKLNARS